MENKPLSCRACRHAAGCEQWSLGFERRVEVSEKFFATQEHFSSLTVTAVRLSFDITLFCIDPDDD